MEIAAAAISTLNCLYHPYLFVLYCFVLFLAWDFSSWHQSWQELLTCKKKKKAGLQFACSFTTCSGEGDRLSRVLKTAVSLNERNTSSSLPVESSDAAIASPCARGSSLGNASSVKCVYVACCQWDDCAVILTTQYVQQVNADTIGGCRTKCSR